MNANRRKTLGAIFDRIEKIAPALAALTEEVDALRDLLGDEASDEWDAYYNLPDSLQDADRGQTMQHAAEELDSAVEALESLADALSDFDVAEVLEKIDDARGPV